MALNGLALLIMSFVQQSALVTLRCCLMNFLTNLLTMKFSFNGRSNNNRPSLLLPTMFLVHLSFMAVTNIQCHPLMEYLLLGATPLVLIHVTLPQGLILFVNSVIAMVTLLRLATNYMVILLIILVIKQIRLIRILTPNHHGFWILAHLTMSLGILIISL